MYGLTRGAMTLIGAAGAGLLLWLGTQMDTDANAGYWAFVGLMAAAGLTIALSQLLGGWTKWGWPTVSPNVLFMAFVPALVAGGWIVLAGQPHSNWFRSRANDWAGDIGLGGVLDDMIGLIPVIALGLGLVFGLVFDTTGPRIRDAEPDERAKREEDIVATEPVTAEREATAVQEYHEPDRAAVAALTGERRDRHVEIREGGSPIGPQPDPENRDSA